MPEIEIKISGDAAVRRMFEQLPAAAQKRVLSPLMQQGGKLLSNAIKGESPIDTGLMSEAIGESKLKTYGGSKLFITAGVRRGFTRAIMPKARGGVKRLGKNKSAVADKKYNRNPARYLHLITGGRSALSAKTSKILYSPQSNTFFGKHVAPTKLNPFVTRAFDSVKDQVVSSVTNSAPALIEAEAAKLAK